MEPTQNPAEKVVGDLQKDFKIVGSHRVHSWYAWAIVGIVFGMALGIIYVANRSVQVEPSSASTGSTESNGMACPSDISFSRDSSGSNENYFTAEEKDGYEAFCNKGPFDRTECNVRMASAPKDVQETSRRMSVVEKNAVTLCENGRNALPGKGTVCLPEPQCSEQDPVSFEDSKCVISSAGFTEGSGGRRFDYTYTANAQTIPAPLSYQVKCLLPANNKQAILGAPSGQTNGVMSPGGAEKLPQMPSGDFNQGLESSGNLDPVRPNLPSLDNR